MEGKLKIIVAKFGFVDSFPILQGFQGLLFGGVRSQSPTTSNKPNLKESTISRIHVDQHLQCFKDQLISNQPKTSRRTFFRACVFTIFLPHIWNGFIFFCGFYNVFLVPCIVLVSEMLPFTMVTKFNYFLLWKLHRFVLYEVVSKACRGSLLQQWFIRFLVFFQSNVFRKRVFLNAANAFTDPHFFSRVTLQVWTCVKYVPKQSIP